MFTANHHVLLKITGNNKELECLKKSLDNKDKGMPSDLFSLVPKQIENTLIYEFKVNNQGKFILDIQFIAFAFPNLIVRYSINKTDWQEAFKGRIKCYDRSLHLYGKFSTDAPFNANIDLT